MVVSWACPSGLFLRSPILGPCRGSNHSLWQKTKPWLWAKQALVSLHETNRRSANSAGIHVMPTGRPEDSHPENPISQRSWVLYTQIPLHDYGNPWQPLRRVYVPVLPVERLMLREVE